MSRAILIPRNLEAPRLDHHRSQNAGDIRRAGSTRRGAGGSRTIVTGVIGIDLGTTNCAVAQTDMDSASSVRTIPIPQLTSPGTIEDRGLLPSFLYLPQTGEFPDGTLAMPWDPGNAVITGEFARAHGVKAPIRLVASAKSWLSYSGADRSSQILPLGWRADLEKCSPVESSAPYLEHSGVWL